MKLVCFLEVFDRFWVGLVVFFGGVFFLFWCFLVFIEVVG